MYSSCKTKSRIAAAFVAVMMILTCFSFADGAYAASKKSPYKKGNNINKAVFYIAVDADGNGKITDEGDAVYYYTYDEIKNAGEEVAFYYGNHGEGETANVKGAKLSTLLDNIEGVDIKDDWIIQYMEEDAYHATSPEYQDTVRGLTDENGVGNGSKSGLPAETVIGYANKTVYDNPDENRVNDTDYVSFLNYEREASYVRAYRQTNSANSSVLKVLKGVVVSNNERADGAALPTAKTGYILRSVDSNGDAIADDYTVQGLMEGMDWPVTPNVIVTWADLTNQSGNWNGVSKVVTIDGNLTTEKKPKPTTVVSFRYKEKTFYKANNNGVVTELLRSNIASQGREFPESNVKDGTSYEFFGYNKPMYVRYQGMYLRSLIDPASDDNVYIVQKNGKALDITDTVDDYFVAYYYTESKSATNISNGKRVPLNYDSAVFVDTKSAEIEYSNNSGDHTPESKKGATIYKNAEIVIAKQPAAVKGLSAKLSKYNSIKASWNKADGADGYRVYYRTGSGKWSSKTVKGTSTVMSGLKSDKTYSVKVKAYNKVNGVKVYSDESAVKSATTLKKVTLTAKVSSGKAKISVSNIKGESGYQIYGKTSKGEWKRVKTLKADKTSYTTVKKLEKGKTYYVKARAYKTVDGKKIYAPWSSVKKIKR